MPKTAEEIRAFVDGQYARVDPWGYRKHPDDAERREKVAAACVLLAPPGGFESALDVGCGEGWITGMLPARRRYGIELSDAAAARFPEDVERLAFGDAGHEAGFGLVVSTETMFEHYDWKAIRDEIVRSCAPGGIIVTCNNPKWEVKAMGRLLGEPLLRVEFPYRGMSMSLKAWRKAV